MNKAKKFIYAALFIFFAAVFVISSAVVIQYVMESREAQRKLNELANIRNDATNPSASSPLVTIPASVDPSNPDTTWSPTQVLPEYAVLYLQNPDLVGWITVPGTNIDYPVLQTPDNKDYYLRRDFYGESDKHGCIYVREECDVLRPSDNLTIYGHHMKDGTMFAALMNYLDESYWEEHQTFTFDTLTEHHTYQIFAVFKTSGTTGQGYPYHQFVDAESKADFLKFVSDCKKMAFYETGISAEYGDKLICLSTCEYTLDNGRFVVVAKRIS